MLHKSFEYHKGATKIILGPLMGGQLGVKSFGPQYNPKCHDNCDVYAKTC